MFRINAAYNFSRLTQTQMDNLATLRRLVGFLSGTMISEAVKEASCLVQTRAVTMPITTMSTHQAATKVDLGVDDSDVDCGLEKGAQGLRVYSLFKSEICGNIERVGREAGGPTTNQFDDSFNEHQYASQSVQDLRAFVMGGEGQAGPFFPQGEGAGYQNRQKAEKGSDRDYRKEFLSY